MNSKICVTTFALVIITTITANASAFWGATVKNVPAGDHLNVRKKSSPSSQVLAIYNNGDELAFTGNCINSKTLKMFDIENIPTAMHRYHRMKAPNIWCEIWLETPAGSGKYDSGWVKGKFLFPG